MASNLIDGLNKPSDILEAITLPGSSCVRKPKECYMITGGRSQR